MTPLAPVHHTRAEAETAALAGALARELHAGDVVELIGELGAGKTAFVRGLAGGLGADPAHVRSPTFALANRYTGGRLPLIHVDAYRLDADDLDTLGLDDRTDAILAIEWPTRAEPIDAARRWRIELTHLGEHEREVRITPPIEPAPRSPRHPPRTTE
ncbi:MAG: tRNA (adenosine(37)-N6)-threonylcarbamoyltransferase complex ATPase subunit type 1 TsaE [Planctomycetota bacterium]